MSFYFNIDSLAFPRYAGDIQLLHPTWQEGDELPENWVEVEETSIPEHKEFEMVKMDIPILENGTWKQTWKKYPMNEQQIIKKKYWKSKIEENQKPLHEKIVVDSEES